MGTSPTIWVVGSLNADLVQRVERLPKPGETISGSDLVTIPGGKGANQACAAARLGGTVRMIGNVGDDELGSLLMDSLLSAGVNTDGVARIDTPTGAASIMVLNDGNNAIILSPGANGKLTDEDVQMRLADIRPGDYVLCQLETPHETVAAALAFAREAGAITLLDPAPASCLSSQMLCDAHFLTPNEIEAPILLGRDDAVGVDVTDVMIEGLVSLGATGVVLKLGEHGCVCLHEEARHRIEGHSVEAVDTTAAGDTFNGAFAVALSEDKAVPDALRFANAAAALSVTRRGAQTSIPERGEVDLFIADRSSSDT